MEGVYKLPLLLHTSIPLMVRNINISALGKIPKLIYRYSIFSSVIILVCIFINTRSTKALKELQAV
jgi:hypothetical protein